jgi:hypothetical protein
MLLEADDLKSYCRIQTTAEDGLCAVLLAQAEALVEAYLGRPLLALARSDTVVLTCAAGVLTLPVWPVDTSAGEVTLTDPDGDVLASANYSVGLNGLVRRTDDDVFAAGAWTAAYTAGWSAHPQWETRYKPLVEAAILDAAADRYQRRNPAATAEAAGGGVRVDYGPSGLPKRVTETLTGLRPMEVW